MRVVFMGTPDFAVPSLEAVLAAGHEVVMVITQPDRPKSRGLKSGASAVKSAAEALGLTVGQPADGRELYRMVKEARADVGAVAAFGRLLGPKTLALPVSGCLAVHPSLLPAFRGAAPIQRAIMAGCSETGVTIIQVTPAFDEGPILAQGSLPIGPGENFGSLHDRLAALGGDLLAGTLADLAAGRLRPRPQDESRVTWAPALTPDDEWLDFRRPAVVLADQVRALDPWPGCRTWRGGEPLKVWRAVALPPAKSLPPGTITAVGRLGIVVACGDGAGRLALAEIQPSGRRRMKADEYARGHRVFAGEVLGPGAP